MYSLEIMGIITLTIVVGFIIGGVAYVGGILMIGTGKLANHPTIY